MKTIYRWLRLAPACAALGLVGLVQATGCAVSADDPEAQYADSLDEALNGDCDGSDNAGNIPGKVGQVFNARLSYRQTNDAGQGITQACNIGAHQVTSQGMRDVPLHCSGKSQAQSGFARVGARWGTSRGNEACNKNFCAAIYIQDKSGGMREVARDIFLKDRFFCGQTDDRNDERLDIDACTYADVIGALKNRGTSSDDSNLSFDGKGKLTGYAAQGLTLKYKMYECGAGPGGGSTGGGGGGTCSDTPPSGSSYSCAQQAGFGKCGESWMKGFCNKSCNRCPTQCSDTPPDGNYTCAQQASWGKCGESWMVPAGHCLHSCNKC